MKRVLTKIVVFCVGVDVSVVSFNKQIRPNFTTWYLWTTRALLGQTDQFLW